MAHQKSDRIAMGAAAKAMVVRISLLDHERRSLFVMERAEGFIGGARFFQLHVRADDFG